MPNYTGISIAAEREAARLLGLFKYSDDQPRDEKGEFASDGVVTHVTKLPYGNTHIVMAYHPDAHSDFHRTSTGFDDELVSHPEGLTAQNIIGHARFVPHSDGGHYAAAVQVHPDWRRQGVATRMYGASTAFTGNTPKPSSEQTPDAKLFWAARGKAEKLSQSESLIKLLYQLDVSVAML
jgi:GNAT superfamily N-acetyltransferase